MHGATIKMLSLYLPTYTINTPRTTSSSQYFKIIQKSDFSSECEHAVSESMRTSTLAPTLSDTEVNTEPVSATTRKEKKVTSSVYNCTVKY